MLLLPIQSPVAIQLTFEEKGDFYILRQKKLTILELSSFIYDFSLLHDCVALSTIPEYENYYFSQYFWYRKGRPLHPEHQLYLNKISYNSPLGLEVIIPATAAALGMPLLIIQAVEKIQNWKLNREKLKFEVEKLKLEVEKLRLEVQQKNGDNFKQDIELNNVLRKPESIETFHRIVKRIEERQLTATDMEIRILDSSNDDKKENEKNTR